MPEPMMTIGSRAKGQALGTRASARIGLPVPFSIFILMSYFESLPDELDKAARVDGCSRLQTLVHVFLPLALPSLVAVVLFTFLTSWNEFLLALMFTNKTVRKFPIFLDSPMAIEGTKIYWDNLSLFDSDFQALRRERLAAITEARRAFSIGDDA